MRKAATSPAPRDEGFALVAVLWFVLLFGALVMAALLAFRDVRHDQALAERLTRAQLLADGFADLLAADIAATRLLRFNGLAMRSGWPLACRQGAIVLVLTATDSNGLLNLNLAPPQLLRKVLVALAGVESRKADWLADAIVDYRDADEQTPDGRSERAAYGRFGLIHQPANAPFRMVEELDRVAGMTPRILARLRPFLTVMSTTANIDERAAPPQLAAILRNRAVDDAATVAERAWRHSLRARNGAAPHRLAKTARRVELRVLALQSGHTPLVRLAGIEFPTRNALGFRYLYWRRGIVTEVERRLALRRQLPPCQPF